MLVNNIEELRKEIEERENRIERVCEYIEDNLIDQQGLSASFLNGQLRNVISILKGESH